MLNMYIVSEVFNEVWCIKLGSSSGPDSEGPSDTTRATTLFGSPAGTGDEPDRATHGRDRQHVGNESAGFLFSIFGSLSL
jgi:hypothetical protein